MKIFGADIGCKNLSYCIFEYNEEIKELKIIDWELINLSSDDNKCCKILRNGKTCDKIAHYYNEDKHYCSAHKVGGSKKIKECDKDKLTDLSLNMKKILDTKKEILNCDKYVIENQPALKNPKMKSISMLLFSYISMFGLKEDITFIHPDAKLKLNEKLTKYVVDNSKNKYKARKNLGICYCKYILDYYVKDNIDWIKLLLNEKKQDDLCDAFLHAYFTIFGKNYFKEEKGLIDYTKQFFNMDINI